LAILYLFYGENQTMQVRALILNHCDDPGNTSREPKVRDITIPLEAAESWDKADDLGKLELVFQYGQNDFSASFPEHNTTYSLSVGDVVCLVDRDYHMDADFDNDDATYTYYVDSFFFDFFVEYFLAAYPSEVEVKIVFMGDMPQISENVSQGGLVVVTVFFFFRLLDNGS